MLFQTVCFGTEIKCNKLWYDIDLKIRSFLPQDPKEAMYAELISQVGKRALKMMFTIKQH